MDRLKGYFRRVVQKVSDTVLGPRYEATFNVPVKFPDDSWRANERLVEWPFIHRQLSIIQGTGLRILDFGCTRSVLPLELAAVGHHVMGIDKRPYPFTYPRFQFVQGDIRSIEFDTRFDVVTCVSTIEHVGLGAYGSEPCEGALRAVRRRLAEVTRSGGWLLITVPVGQEHTDDFLRSFAPDTFIEMFRDVGFESKRDEYFLRLEQRYWSPVERGAIMDVSNRPEDRGPTGVNAVGCFALVRTANERPANGSKAEPAVPPQD